MQVNSSDNQEQMPISYPKGFPFWKSYTDIAKETAYGAYICIHAEKSSPL